MNCYASMGITLKQFSDLRCSFLNCICAFPRVGFIVINSTLRAREVVQAYF